jgi:tRNA (uracil-5-)-methyltransferase
MQPIVAAPTPLRNKCEFTFGYRYFFDEVDKNVEVNNAVAEPDETVGLSSVESRDTEPRKVPAVGFMVTGWAGGVSFSDTLSNIPSEAGAVVGIVNNFLSTSPLVPYDSKAHRGFWRILTMRTSRRTQECMVIIQHSPASSGGQGEDEACDCTKEFETEKTRLIALLTEAELPTEPDEPSIKVTSIFFQEFGGLSNPTPEHPVQVRIRVSS